MSNSRASRSAAIARRTWTVPLLFLALALATLLLPALVLAAVLFDALRWMLTRRRWMAYRLVVMGWIYLFAEVLGIIGLFFVWVASFGGRSRRLFLAGTYAIQRWWAGLLFDSIRTLFRLDLEVEGASLVSTGPFVVLMRHASIIDNLLPNALITAPHRIKLKYVLKRELLSDPALDIAGNRLPNYFVDRSAIDSTAEVEEVASLAADLAADEGVLIYPEGTRFTTDRRARALSRLESSHPDLYARASGWTSVLPPRIGGTTALLSVTPPIDVVVAAHTGLDGFSHIRNILDGGLVGSTIRVRFERHAGEDIPRGGTATVDWLFDKWSEVNAWIVENSGNST